MKRPSDGPLPTAKRADCIRLNVGGQHFDTFVGIAAGVLAGAGVADDDHMNNGAGHPAMKAIS